MTISNDLTPTVDRIIRDVRRSAADLPFDERARLLRGVVHEMSQAIKEDATTGGAPKGRAWELDGIAPIRDTAERHYFACVEERDSRR